MSGHHMRSYKHHPASKATPYLPFIEDNLHRHPLKTEVCVASDGRKVYKIYYNDGRIEHFFHEDIVTSPTIDLKFNWSDNESRKYSSKYDPSTGKKPTEKVLKRSKKGKHNASYNEEDYHSYNPGCESKIKTPGGQHYHYTYDSTTPNVKDPHFYYPPSYGKKYSWKASSTPMGPSQTKDVPLPHPVPVPHPVPGTTQMYPGMMYVTTTFVPQGSFPFSAQAPESYSQGPIPTAPPLVNSYKKMHSKSMN